MRTGKDYLFIALKGVAMGAADVIPGVSGGTIAFISGIYEELINSIKSFNLTSLKLLLAGRFRDFWQTVNGNFLLSLIVGIAISIFSLAKLMEYLLHTRPIQVWSFFFGLIVASAIYVSKSIQKWTPMTIISVIVGVAAAWYITTVVPAQPNTSWWFVILSGAIAICAMILPGISGSFILVLLGMYGYMLEALTSFNIPVISLFVAGAAVGIISFSNILSWLLRKYRNLTIALLAGFMIGSLNKIWPWKKVIETYTDRHGEVVPLIQKNIFPYAYESIMGESSMLWPAIAMAIIGFSLIFVIEGIAQRLQKK